jgi:acetolactate synthase-1/2/3 large subunit
VISVGKINAPVREQQTAVEPARRMTGGQALVEMLKREGVDTIFGLPGVQLDGFFSALYDARDDIRVIHTRHEQATAYMADGYARSTGKLGVCLVVPGPGLLNATGALSTAYATNSPVLCITGQIQSDMIGVGRGLLHEIPNQLEMVRSVTKSSERAMTPAEIPGVFANAIRELRTGRPRPVEIEVPPDIFFAEGDVSLVSTLAERERPAGDPVLIEAAAKTLAGAKFPIIYAGGGIQRGEATAELLELAELLQAPVVMSTNGKGSISDRHPLAFSQHAATKVQGNADVLFGVGTRFLDINNGPRAAKPGQTTIHLDIDPEELGRNFTADIQIEGDVKTGLQAIIDEVKRRQSAARPSRAAEFKAIKDESFALISTIQPQAGFAAAIRQEVPDDGILVQEMTQVSYFSHMGGMQVYEPNTYIGPGYQGTLGFGFCTALGAKVGNPDKVVVSINGDGGFGFTLNELATMAQHDIAAIAVVFNDSAYGNVKRIQEVDLGGKVLGSELKNPDYVKLADAFGITGRRTETADGLAKALNESIKANEPTLIEVPVGQMPNPWRVLGFR